MSHNDDDTVADFPAYVPAQKLVAESFDEQVLEIGALTHRGSVRKTNEDQYCLVRRTRKSVVLASSLADEKLPDGENHAYLLAVADGLGGQAAGEVASEVAIRTMLEFSNKLSNWIMRPEDGLREAMEQRVELYVQAIQREIQWQAESNPELAGMATTITAAYLFGSNAMVVNLGDSRVYLVRSGRIHQITQDHTLAQELKDKGLASEYARPYRNVVTRCFNTDRNTVNIDVFHLDLKQDDQILLCSDGLTDMVPDPVILQTITSASSTKIACEKLVSAALTGGGRDNITVVLARITSS